MFFATKQDFQGSVNGSYTAGTIGAGLRVGFPLMNGLQLASATKLSVGITWRSPISIFLLDTTTRFTIHSYDPEFRDADTPGDTSDDFYRSAAPSDGRRGGRSLFGRPGVTRSTFCAIPICRSERKQRDSSIAANRGFFCRTATPMIRSSRPRGI